MAALMVSANAAILPHMIENDPGSSSILSSAEFIGPIINFNSGALNSGALNIFLNTPTFFHQQNGFDPMKAPDNAFPEVTGQSFLLGIFQP